MIEPVVPPVAASNADLHAEAEAHTALAAFFARVRAPARSEADVEGALQDALRDLAPLPAAAVERFEAGLAHMLVQGWQPGHEFLLGPAAQRLGWCTHTSRLERLGATGRVLKLALLQQQYFFRKQLGAQETYDALLRRLRDATDPTQRLLVEDIPLLFILKERCPNWLPIVVPRANVERWYALHDALPESAKPKRLADIEESAASNRSPWGWIIWVALVLMRVLYELLKSH